ncbi:MAG: hypothetical protein QXS19_06460, partial [Candidatus Methanomethylicia archaeon]
SDFTLTIDDFLVDESIIDNYEKEISKTHSLLDRYNILQKYFKIALDDLRNKNSNLIKIVESGVRANYNQLQQVIIGRGVIDTGLHKYFIAGNYAKGLSIDEYVKSSEGARKSIFDKTISTSKPGYLTRQLVYTLHPYKFSADDCGTKKFLKLPFKKFGKDWFIGKYYLNPLTQKLELFTEDTEYNFDYILIRSVLYCEKPVCRKCFGHIWHDYENIGIITAQTLGERGTQLTLRAFHTGSVYDIPQETIQTVNELKDLVYIDRQQNLVLAKDAYIKVPEHTILLKDNTVLTNLDLYINDNKLTLTTGMKLYVHKSDHYTGNTNIAKLNVSSIANIITVLEALLRRKLVFSNLESLVYYLEILYTLFSYSAIFPLGMIELLVRATLDKDNITEFPVTKLPINLVPHVKGYGCTFEKARTALMYTFYNEDYNNLAEKYDLFKYTGIKGIGYYIGKMLDKV